MWQTKWRTNLFIPAVSATSVSDPPESFPLIWNVSNLHFVAVVVAGQNEMTDINSD